MSITQDPPFRDGADQAPDPGWTVPGVGIPTQRTGPENQPDAAGDRGAATGSPAAAGAAPAADAAPAAESVSGPGLEDLADSGTETPGHPVVVAVATCLEALDGIKTTSTVGLTAKEIRLMLLAVVHLAAALFALKMRLLVAGEVHRVHDLTGATSLPAFLAHLTQTPRADASAQVRLAKDLDRRWPLLADALAAGRINPDQTKIAVTALRRLPKNLTAEQNDAVQHCLIQAAQTMTGRQLKAVGRHLWDVIDPDGADKRAGKDLEDEEERARARAYFTSWRNGDGTTGFRGKLPDAQADMLLKALTALASPRRRTNPHIRTSQPDDTGSEPNNTGHGNDDGCDGGNAAGHGTDEPGDRGGNDDTAHGSSGSAEAASDGGYEGCGHGAGHSDSEGQGAGHSEGDSAGDEVGYGSNGNGGDNGAARGSDDAGNDGSGDQAPSADPDPPADPPDPPDPGQDDPPRRSRLFDPDHPDDADDTDPEERETGRPVPYPVRLGHALMELLERLPTDLLPTSGGVNATIVVTTTLENLRTGVGTATLDTGTEISPAQLRRLACEAGIIPAVLDGESQPLDLGREQRLYNRYQRTAMAIRDKTCRAEGCDRPAAWCAAHHLLAWSRGGPTDLAHGALVCDYHHHLIHSTNWTHHLLPDGQIRFRRQ